MSKKRFYLAPEIRLFQKLILIFVSFILGITWLAPVFTGSADALQITNRSVTLSSGQGGQTSVTYTFSFRTATNNQNLWAIKFIACTTALGSYEGGTCTSPGGIHFDLASYNVGAEAGFTDTTNHFANDTTGANDCLSGATHPNVLCIKKTASTGNDTNNTTNKTIQFTGITNPTSSGAGTTFFIGIVTYSANTYTAVSVIDSGSVATAVLPQFIVAASVAEILNFCVGSTSVNDATTSPATDCTGISNNTVNLGTLDPSTINTTPVNTNGGSNTNGIAMVRSNAVNGITVSYDAIQDAGSNHLGTLRFPGATCSAATGPGSGSPPAASGPFTDQCIDAAGATQNTFTAGSEEFGMDVNDNCGSTTSYTCVATGAAHSNNLIPASGASGYLGAGTAGNPSYGTSNGFGWVESGTVTQIASSTTVVDDESLILRFAATPAITTPFGSYQVKTDFIAVATY